LREFRENPHGRIAREPLQTLTCDPLGDPLGDPTFGAGGGLNWP
jgi:hypothetical protein